jgi:hypothetical protein
VTDPREPVNQWQLSQIEEWRELWEPPDHLRPDYPDYGWLPRRPEFVIDVTQLWSLLPDQAPSHDQTPDTGPTRTRDPEPDLEAEP